MEITQICLLGDDSMSVIQETELRLQQEAKELALREHDQEIALKLQVYKESLEIKRLMKR